MAKRIYAIGTVGAIGIVILSGCSRSHDEPTSPNLTGTWTSESVSKVVSDGQMSSENAEQTFVFGVVSNGVFQYRIDAAAGSPSANRTWFGQGSVGPNGNVLMNVNGESMVMQGSVDSSGILNLQSVELAEVGASLDSAPDTVFAGITRLKRTSDASDVGAR